MATLPRLNNIVVLRSFAIIAVVFYHCYCPWLDAWNWFECPSRKLYSFVLEIMLVGRMPLFVFVSGYLFSHLVIDRGKYSNFKKFVLNKVNRLLVPCLAFTGIMCIVLRENYINAVLYSCYHLWFLKMLFWCFITAWILNKLLKKNALRLFAFVGSLFLMIVPGLPILGIDQYCKYFSFFYFGYIFYAYRDKLRFIFIRKFSIGIYVLYFIICLIVGCIYVNSNGTDLIHTNKIIVLSRYILRPLTILIALILVDDYIKSKSEISIVFTNINNISYGIYLFHMLFLQLLRKYFYYDIFFFAESHYVLTPLLLFFFVLTASVLMCKLLKKYQWSKWIIG